MVRFDAGVMVHALLNSSIGRLRKVCVAAPEKRQGALSLHDKRTNFAGLSAGGLIIIVFKHTKDGWAL